MATSISMVAAPQRGGSEWRSGWTIVLTAMAGMYVSCFYIYSFGVFIEPLQQEYGWARQDISLGLTLCTFVAALAMPLVGLVADRMGARPITIVGLFCYAAALALLARTGPSVESWWIGWIVVGLAYAMVNAAVWIHAVAQQFTRHRGMAFSLTLVGTSACAGTLPILAYALIGVVGWRGAYVALAAGVLLIQLPLVLAFLPKPSHRKGRPAQSGPGLSRRDILRAHQFWKLAAIALIAVTGLVGLMVHFVPILSGAGISRGTAVAIAGLIGLSSIAGRLLGGYCLDRIPGPLIGGVIFSLPILVCLFLFLAPESPWVAVAAALLLGLSFGGESDVLAYVSARYFGLRHYGFGYSIITCCMVCGGGLGPYLAAVAFDKSGDYGPFVLALATGFATCVLLVTTLGPYPKFDEDAHG